MDERKIFYSFYDMPRETSYSPSLRFSSTELWHILVAMIVLSMAFSFAVAGGLGGALQNIDSFPIIIFASFS